uniref:ubiquitin carboxyl-terminal hydrolase 12-like n=1 Tax=Semicossyphus pulcher TaxID=241346 RepID=UPI0037E71E03
MNHELVETFRKKLDSCTISDYHGLKSPGLTCYLNSVLQVLFMTEDFREAVKQCYGEDSTTIDSHLAKLFADLEVKVSKTREITRKLGITNVYEQRDAAEYLEKILCLTNPEASKMFKGELNHRTRCLRCKDTNDTRNFFWILPLAVEESRHQIFSVEKGLEAFFKGGKVSGDNKIYCDQCQKKQDADFGCRITQTPEILTLLLKRFSFDCERRCYVKLHCKVEVPQNVHIQNCTYDLYALVNHYGDLTGGHYTAHIRSFETQGWYLFNDDVVKGVRESLFGAGGKSLRSRTAYLLMYRKVRKHAEESDLEASCSNSDDAEGGHEEAERGETLVPRRPLKDERNAEGNSQHLNGDMLIQSHNDDVKTVTNFQQEPEAACLRPHKEMNQKDGGEKSHEPNRQQLDTTSMGHTWHLNKRGTPTEHFKTQHVDSASEQKHDTRKKRVKEDETEITRNGTDRVERAETKAVRNKRDDSHTMTVKQTVTKREKSPRNAAKSRDKVQQKPWK